MSHTKVNPTGWSFGASFTSPQANQFDTNQATSTDDTQFHTIFARSAQPPLASLGNTPYAIAWNDVGQFFYFAEFTAGGSPNINIYQAYGQDATAPSSSSISIGSNNPATSMAVTSAGVLWVVTTNGSASNAVNVSYGGGAFITPTSVNSPTDFKIAAIGTTIVGAIGSSVAAGILCEVTTGGLVEYVATLTVQSWALKSNGTYALAVPLQAGPPSVYKTTTGTSWTSSSLSGVIGTSDVPIDIAWSPYLSKWLMAVSVSGGNNTAFYSSPDGVTWTATGTTLSSSNPFKSLCAIGAIWVGTTYNSSTYVGQLAHSPDGVSWYASPVFLRPGFANTPVVVSGITTLVSASLIPYATTGEAGVIRFSPSAIVPDVTMS